MADRDFVYNRTTKGRDRYARWRERNRKLRNASARTGLPISSLRQLSDLFPSLDIDKIGRTR